MALFEESIIYSRWQSFCAICLYISIAGTVYAFNIYGELMKSELGYTQSMLSVIASVGNSGNLFALPIGFCIERYGNRITMYFGCTCVFVGYVFIWLALIKYYPSSVESVTLFYFISQIGICCFVATAITSSIKLFPPESRGTAIGLCRAYFGLSSAVLGDLAGGAFLQFPNHFVLFVAFFIPIVG
jgi:MFS family permease